MTKNVIGSDPVLERAPEPEPDHPSRHWALPAILLVAIAAAAAIAFYVLRSPGATPTPGKPGVDATTVDLSSQSPEAAPAPSPEKTAPPAPASPPPPSLPAPTPSRRASGVVAPAPPRAATTGNLLVRSTPANADVLVNGRARGRTPLALRDVPLGSYTIRVAREGYAAEERMVDLTARRPTAAATIVLRAHAQADAAEGATAPGGINVQSRPSGARVFVDDRLMGSTPLTIPGLPAGPATVRIEMDGYQTWSTTVQVGAREPIRVAASLDRR
jgi:PEGA domain